MTKLVSLTLLTALALASHTALAADPFKVTLDTAQNGSFTISPPLPEDHTVPAGTELKITATPAPGFALDAIYHIGIGTGPQGRMYYESAAPETTIKIDGTQRIGASFIEQKQVAGFSVKNDIVFAQPGAKKLKYDVFTPDNAKALPCIIIIHGGAWATNNEDVMRGLARELVRPGRYVVISVDYRWINSGDGDPAPVTMANIIEDVFGAIAHIQEHAAEYGADPTRLAVTGDSAGGHLAAVAINMADRIGDQGFGLTPGVYQFKPTYLPKNKPIDQVRTDILHAIKAAAPSYGIFDKQGISRFTGNLGDGASFLAPQENIPNIKDRPAPQFLLRGTNDNLVRDPAVQAYTDALKAAGQRAEYVQVPGAGHAFLDWKPDPRVKATFYRLGVPYAQKIEEFFDSIFYPK